MTNSLQFFETHFASLYKRLLSLLRWYRNAGYFYIDRAQVIAAGEIKGLPVGAAKSEVSRGGRAVDDAPELFALGVDDPQPAGATAIDIAFDIDLHAVGNAGFVPTQIDKYAITG